MNPNIKDYLEHILNIPSDLSTLINKFHGSILRVDNESNFSPIIDELKVHISTSDNYFIIRNLNIANIKCVYARNLACECYLWDYIQIKLKHYTDVKKKKKRIIFSYSLNQDIAIFRFFKQTYFEKLNFEKLNDEVICNCTKCFTFTNKLKNTKTYTHFKNYNYIMLYLSRIKRQLLKDHRLPDKPSMFTVIYLPEL